ncbi:MAG TPA: hypothetical protein VGO47_04795, partial [Chlamydiales bacterium]|nr:hypothetical protein [Chlamydiales bacterium]
RFYNFATRDVCIKDGIECPGKAVMRKWRDDSVSEVSSLGATVYTDIVSIGQYGWEALFYWVLTLAQITPRRDASISPNSIQCR